MILESIELENIRSYQKQKIEFPKGITLFEGDIGSGKSSILMGIEFALFGTGSQKGDSLLSKNSKDGSITLCFSVDGTDYEIRRGLKRTPTSVNQNSKECNLKIDGENYPLAASELKQEVLKILKFNEPAAGNAQSRIFRYAVFTPQREMSEILLNAEKRLETIRRAFGVEDYKKAIENATRISSLIKNRADILQERFRNVPELESSIDKLKQEIEDDLEKEIKLNKRTFNNFSVLYRTNAQSRALEESFIRQGIPYNIIGSLRFYERKEVKNVLAYLRLVVNLKDTISLRRIINFPARGIGAKTIDKCVQQSEKDKIEFIDVLKNSDRMDIRGKQADSLSKFYKIIKKYHDLREKLSASELARSLIEEIGILSYFKNSTEPDAKDRFDNVAELLTSIEEFSVRDQKASLSRFLEDVSLQTDIDHWNDSDNRVTMMTIHSSKGLEFPVVFIAGMDEGLFPLFNSIDDKEELEEERRLFYVALTRAEERVYILYATNRRRMGVEMVNGLPSRFINEIPENSLERISFSSSVTRKFVSGTRKKDGLTQMVRTVTDFDDFQVGDNVEHSIFGAGKIMALSGTGENQRVGVVFSDGTKKKLIVKFANLKKI